MNYYESIKYHPIFQGIKESDIKIILDCFCFQEKTYKKEEYIILEGDPVEYVGVILHGIILMEKNDLYGNNYFFTELREHEIFAEPFMDTNIRNCSVNYKAMTNCSILIFPYRLIWQRCSKNCTFHTMFIENLMNLLALKTRTLLAKLEILSKKSIRDRILTFLHMIRTNQDIVGFHNMNQPSNLLDNEVFIPLNHTEMAEYLCVNRSALVREISKMKAESIISVKNNTFHLLS